MYRKVLLRGTRRYTILNGMCMGYMCRLDLRAQLLLSYHVVNGIRLLKHFCMRERLNLNLHKTG